MEYPHRAPGSGEIELEALTIQVVRARTAPSMAPLDDEVNVSKINMVR